MYVRVICDIAGVIYRRSLWINYKERVGKSARLSTPRNLYKYELRNAISCKLDSPVQFHIPVPHVVFRHMYNKVAPSRDTYIKNTARMGKTAISRPFLTSNSRAREGFQQKKAHSLRIFRVWVFARAARVYFVSIVFYISPAQSVSLLRPCVVELRFHKAM